MALSPAVQNPPCRNKGMASRLLVEILEQSYFLQTATSSELEAPKHYLRNTKTQPIATHKVETKKRRTNKKNNSNKKPVKPECSPRAR